MWLLAAGAVVVAACSGSPPQPDYWGDAAPKYSYPRRAEPPEGVFVDLSAGQHRTCGVRDSGEIECWGFNYGDPPEGRFVKVDVGAFGDLGNMCAVAVDASVACTSDKFNDPADPFPPSVQLPNEWGQADAPDGEFVDVSVARWFSCGLRADGSAQCWGADLSGKWLRIFPAGALEVPEGPFVEVHAGDPPCALRASGELVCWTERGEYWSYPMREERFVRVSTGRRSTEFFGGGSGPPPYACGIRRDLTLRCLTLYNFPVPAPGGEFVQVDHIGGPACGLRTDHTIVCWNPGGRPSHDVLADPPAGRFSQIAVGAHHACAIRLDGTVACWGENTTELTNTCDPKKFVCPD